MHLAATFDIITPVFCAGAEQNGGASIRPMSIRGCLRYWYRAIDEQFRENEPRIFGAAAAGQGSRASPMVLSVVEPCRGNRDFSGKLQAHGEDSRGAAYLGYALYLGENRRKGIEPGRQFVLHVRERWTGEGDLVRRAWIASIWLLGHLGGIGARSRRALGTCALRQWNSPEGWPERPELAHGAATVDDWLARFRRGLETLRRWFPPAGLAGHQHQMLGPNPEIFLFREGARSWDEAMDRAGDTLRSVRRDLAARGGDVHLWLASLGMPRKFRNPPEMATLQAIDRSASRVHIRIVRIGPAFHPLFVVMGAPVAPPGTLVVFRRDNHERRTEEPDRTEAALDALRNRLHAAALAI
jgi:CRISPR-associated protein Cmr1